jgi:hypothetical protein
MDWQRASGHNWRALVEADIGRYKRVIGDALRSWTEGRQTTKVAIAVASLNRILELGRPRARSLRMNVMRWADFARLLIRPTKPASTRAPAAHRAVIDIVEQGPDRSVEFGQPEEALVPQAYQNSAPDHLDPTSTLALSRGLYGRAGRIAVP